jgi:hypothetical protein
VNRHPACRKIGAPVYTSQPPGGWHDAHNAGATFEHVEKRVAGKELTNRELLQRQRAARLVERSLPDLIRRAYADAADADRASARAALVTRGHLSQDEFETLPVDEAIAVALQRVRAESATLQERSAQRASQERGGTDIFTKPPRTLR